MAQQDHANVTDAPFQQVFEVEPRRNPERKCLYCGYEAVNRYLIASGESHAKVRREAIADDPDKSGMCGDCLARHLAEDGVRLTSESDQRPFAAGIELPAVGMDVNGGIPPAGEPYCHDEFEPHMERCPVDDCGGSLTRTKVVADSGSGDEQASHVDTIEVTCQSCQRVLLKSESVVYDGLDRD